MGSQAAGAVLDPLRRVAEIPATPISQGIQGAIAEQAAKGFRIRPLMAGEILAGFMLKEIVIRHIPPQTTFQGNFSGGWTANSISTPVFGWRNFSR